MRNFVRAGGKLDVKLDDPTVVLLYTYSTFTRSTKGDDIFGQPRQLKRSAPGRSRDDQPPAKLQKRDVKTNLSITDIENLDKKRSIDKSVDVIPTLSQTNAQAAAYNDRDHDIYTQNAFFDSTGMNPSDPDRSSIIVRGADEDRVLTATSHETFRGPVTYLFETTSKLQNFFTKS